MDIENMNIEKATERCNQLTKPEHANWIGISNQIAIRNVLEELKKKDLIINEMAKFIAGLDIDELICKDREHCTGDYEYETCEECIKEYFTKKVEGK